MDSNKGHRTRARERLLKSKSGSLYDYEILELILFNSIPRKDVKDLSKNLLKEFGSLGNVINASTHKLQQFSGIGNSSITLFRLIQELVIRTNKEELSTKPVISSWDKLINYIRANIGYKTTENLHTIFLNSKNMLIADEIQNYGTVNSIGVYPREIAKSALYHDASSVVLVHNHPSGITKPSKSDISLTEQVVEALTPLKIILLDHIIISKNSYFSFKANSLL